MKRIKTLDRGAMIALAITLFSFILLSWGFKQEKPSLVIDQLNQTDTIPDRDRKIRDLDDVLVEMDAAELLMDKDLKLNLEKMKKELAENLSKIDMTRIKADIELQLKAIDVEKMKLKMEEAMSKIDWEKMQKDMEKIKDVDLSKMELEMKNIDKQLSRIGPEIEKSMEKAKAEMAKAKKQIKEYNDFVDQLEKDGLLKRADGYSIKHSNGEFFINGKKQPNDVYNKYKAFLEKHKDFRIKKTDDDFDIDIDED